MSAQIVQCFAFFDPQIGDILKTRHGNWTYDTIYFIYFSNLIH